MNVRLVQSYYVFELTNKEMGKLRTLRGIGNVIDSIASILEVRGVMVSDVAIEVNIQAARKRVPAVVEKIEGIISEALI